MSLYSVLMVDDEEEVIQIIRRKIDWESLGFYVCGQARNGIEALEMVEDLEPDVVMTDIKMPYMDGLEFARRLKEKYRDIRIIIFSGFDEFEYAKQAIGLEVDEYLLKPLDASELSRVYEKMKIHLDEDRDLRNNIAHLENYYEKSLPIMQQGFFSELMEDTIPNDLLQEYMEEYHISLSAPYYAISIIHTSSHATPQGMSHRLFRMSIRQLIENSAIMERKSYLFDYRNNLVAITPFDNTEEISHYTDECDRICKTCRRSYQAVVTIGIGKPVSDLSDLHLSYKGAREAVSYRTIHGAGNAINIMEIDPQKDSIPVYGNTHLSNIFKQIKLGREEDLSLAIQEYMESLSQANLSLQMFGITMMEMISAYYRFLNENNLDFQVIHLQNEDVYLSISHMDSLEEIGEWLTITSMKVRNLLQEQRISKTGSFVRQAEDYVKEHYSNPELSIDLLCSELGVSSSYFSTIFKKETGKTFVNYLTEYRMKEAERLLIEENEKKYIIAEKVGYTDPSYFSYVFKKWFGMSPMKYKNQRTGS